MIALNPVVYRNRIDQLRGIAVAYSRRDASYYLAAIIAQHAMLLRDLRAFLLQEARR